MKYLQQTNTTYKFTFSFFLLLSFKANTCERFTQKHNEYFQIKNVAELMKQNLLLILEMKVNFSQDETMAQTG